MHLFCLPHAGGGRSAFSGWLDNRQGIEISVQTWAGALPRTASVDDMMQVVQTVGQRILKQSHGDFGIVGASAGARVGYRVAEWIWQHYPDRGPSILVMIAPPPARLATPITDLLALDDHELVTLLRRLGGVPEAAELKEQLWRPFLGRTRRQLELIASETGFPTKRGGYRLKIVAGHADPLLPPSLLQAWPRAIGAACDVHMWPGDHFFWQKSNSLFDFITDTLSTSNTHLRGD